MVKKLLSALLCATLVATSLMGCTNENTEADKPVTIESLLSDSNKKQMESADMDLKLVMDADIHYEEGGSSIKMNMAMKLTAKVLTDKDTMHMKGNVEAKVMGMEVTQPMESYVQKNGDTSTTYNYDSDSDTWTSSSEVSSTDSTVDVSGVTNVTADILKDAKLEETENAYVITATISAKDMADSLGLSSEDVLGDLSGDSEIDYNTLAYQATISFDKESKNMKSIKFAVNTDAKISDSLSFNEYVIEVTFNKINDVNVSVPDEVLNETGNSNGNETNDNKNDNGNSNTNISTGVSPSLYYQFSVNNKIIALPCSYNDIKQATGWTMKSADEKSYLESNYSTYVNLYDANGDTVAYIDIVNLTDGDVCYADCTVYAISQSDYCAEKGQGIVFYKDLVAGQEISLDELIQKLGQPSYKYEDTEDKDWLQRLIYLEVL